MEWNKTVPGVALTWAWWRLQTGNPRSWCGCCRSSWCPSLGRTASWTAAACKPEWSGPAACRDVRLARRSAAPASGKTGGSGCSPSERELRTGDRKDKSGVWPVNTQACFSAQKKKNNSKTCPGNTLLQLHGTDRTWVVSVILLEQRSPPLHEVPQRREAEHVYSARPCLVKHVWWGRQCGGKTFTRTAPTRLFTILFQTRGQMGGVFFPRKRAIHHARSRSHALCVTVTALLVAGNVQNKTKHLRFCPG